MEWLVLIAVIASALVHFLQWAKIRELSAREGETTRSKKADNARWLSALAREIANELVRRDSLVYEQKFEGLVIKWNEISKKSEHEKKAHFLTVCSSYPSFAEFDCIGTFPHVIYADAFDDIDDEDLWEKYEGLRLYDALCSDMDKVWRYQSSGISERELTHLHKYRCKIEDTILLEHLYKAREQFYHLIVNVAQSEGEWTYETKDYKFKRVADVVESRWGVYVKAINRYGIWSSFDERTSFEAADDKFNERGLDSLGIRLCLGARELSRIETEK